MSNFIGEKHHKDSYHLMTIACKKDGRLATLVADV